MHGKPVVLEDGLAAAVQSGSMEGLSIAQLKCLIKSRGASHADCLERTDLEARALQACQPAAE